MTKKESVYQSVTDRIVAALEAGETVPWQRPWKSAGGIPYSIRSGKPYRGINPFLLLMENYDDPRWGTFKAMREAAITEARSQGREIVIEQVFNPKTKRMQEKAWEIIDGKKVWFQGGVKRDERGTQIVLWKPVPKKPEGENENPGQYMLLRFYSVFNAKQADGLPELPVDVPREFTPIEAAEQIVSGYVWTTGSENGGPSVSFGHNQAAYSPRQDRVEMPDPEQFVSDESYYCTIFHELVHSTGHEKRLKRLEPALFGSNPYAREELVAEVGSSFLAGLSGFESAGGDQSAAYVAGWLEPLKNDPKLVVQAAAQAQKAVDLILGTTFEDVEREQPERELVSH